MKSDQLLFWKYVTPSIFGAVIGGSFAIVDTIFIGLAGGKNALAATAVTWPLVMLLQAFGFLVGSGGAVLIAQSRGGGRDGKGSEGVLADAFSGCCLEHSADSSDLSVSANVSYGTGGDG